MRLLPCEHSCRCVPVGDAVLNRRRRATRAGRIVKHPVLLYDNWKLCASSLHGGAMSGKTKVAYIGLAWCDPGGSDLGRCEFSHIAQRQEQGIDGDQQQQSDRQRCSCRSPRPPPPPSRLLWHRSMIFRPDSVRLFFPNQKSSSKTDWAGSTPPRPYISTAPWRASRWAIALFGMKSITGPAGARGVHS